MLSLVTAAFALASAEPAPDPVAEADAAAAAYEAYHPLAEALGRATGLAAHDRDVAGRVAGEPPYPADLQAALDERRAERRGAVAAAVQRHDPLALMDEAPQTANYLTRLVRVNIDPELSRALIARFEPLAGTPALHRMVFESLSVPDEPEPAPPTRDAEPDTLARFLAELTEYEALVGEIGAAEGRDQFVRAVFVPKLASFGAQADAFIDAFEPVISAVDARNTELASEVLAETGFRALHHASPTTAQQIVRLYHHGASIDQRRALLAEIEPLALAGAFDGQRYALMYDRVARMEDKPQRYGSQSECVDGRRQIAELEDPARVDEWRAQMGLEPLEAYRQSLIEMYGPEC
ncbi:MAG: DUF6624 domain-containing protein [Pseudomonadota bacterium]